VIRRQKTQRQKNSNPWEPTATSCVLKVPLAEMWHEGMTIADDKGNIIYKVLQNKIVRRAKSGDPIFQATIGNDRDEVIAVVRREMDFRHQIDGFTIYSLTPNWAGQSATTFHPIKNDERGFEMFSLVRFEQSPLGGNYTLKSSEDDGIIMKAENSNIRLTFLCCPCLLCGCCKAWQLEFFRAGQGSHSVLDRDQKAMTVTVAPGETLILAVCMAYAVDRLTIYSCV